MRRLAMIMLATSGCAIPVAEEPAEITTSEPTPAVATPQPRRPVSLPPPDLRSLPPSAFRELPAALVANLEQRGCTIPEISRQPEKSNVIQGEFFAGGQPGWAVVCSSGGFSQVLVFRSPTDREPVQFNRIKNPDCEGATWDCGFWLGIYTASPERIRYYQRSFNAPEPPPLDHDGVDIAAVGKASSIRYLHNGEWLTLQGGD